MAGPRSATYDSSAMAATATLASKAVTVTPGGEAVAEVRIRNSGTVVDQFTLEVLGDASAWALVEPAVVPLFPGAEAVARVKFKPPKSSSVLAKAIPFAVRVRSREDARASLVEEGVVEVGPFNDTTAELIPRTAKGSSRARAQLALDNRGNTRINARLTAADPDRKLNFTITPPALTAEPGTASFATVRVSPRQRFLTGPPKISPYKVLVHQDGLPTITVDGSMQQVGLIPAWLLPALIGLAALLLVLVILWFVLLKPSISSAAKDAVAPQASAAQSAAARAQSAAAAAGQKPTAGGATGANPFGGDAYAARLSGSSSLTVPNDGGLSVTDLIFENPNGYTGNLQLSRFNALKKQDQGLLTLKLDPASTTLNMPGPIKVTAAIVDWHGAASKNLAITFTNTTDPNKVSQLGKATTDKAGQASFSYSNTKEPRIDVIQATYSDGLEVHKSNRVFVAWLSGPPAAAIASPAAITVTPGCFQPATAARLASDTFKPAAPRPTPKATPKARATAPPAAAPPGTSTIPVNAGTFNPFTAVPVTFTPGP